MIVNLTTSPIAVSVPCHTLTAVTSAFRVVVLAYVAVTAVAVQGYSRNYTAV